MYDDMELVGFIDMYELSAPVLPFKRGLAQYVYVRPEYSGVSLMRKFVAFCKTRQTDCAEIVCAAGSCAETAWMRHGRFVINRNILQGVFQ